MLYLFYLPTCPYCKKVLDYLTRTDLNYTLLDINNQENLEELLKVGGKRQVPFLMDSDNSVDMYESDDIIEYLKTLA